MPYTGPNAKVPTRTGISEKSNFRNGGISGSGTSRNMRATASAVKIAVVVMRTMIGRRLPPTDFLESDMIFTSFHPDFTVGRRISLRLPCL